MTEARITQSRPAVFPLAFIAGAILGTTLFISASGGHGIPCLFKAMFHIPCPGCGMTRSLEALWTANVGMSLRYHPLGLPLFAACFFVLVLTGARAVGARVPLGVLSPSRQTWLAIGVLLLSVWVVRLAD